MKTEKMERVDTYGRVVAFLKASPVAFTSACEKAGIPPTRRQASKWMNGKGLALQTHRSSKN
jgi:hypothetical protein